MTRDEYVNRMQQLLSRDPEQIRDANRALFAELVGPFDIERGNGQQRSDRAADLVLAEIAQ